jgi:hypothetical protein
MVTARQDDDVWDRVRESYIDADYGRCIKLTLQPIAGDITTVEIPNEVKGIKFFPIDNHVIFSIKGLSYDEVPVTLNASGNQNIVLGDLGVGHIAMANTWEIRLLPAGPLNQLRKLRLLSDVGNTVVYLEFWG